MYSTNFWCPDLSRSVTILMLFFWFLFKRVNFKLNSGSSERYLMFNVIKIFTYLSLDWVCFNHWELRLKLIEFYLQSIQINVKIKQKNINRKNVWVRMHSVHLDDLYLSVSGVNMRHCEKIVSHWLHMPWAEKTPPC